MESTGKHIDDLIAGYLAGEASAAERAAVEAWIGQAESNQRYFLQLKIIFEKAGAATIEDFDTDEAWRKLRSKMQDKSSMSPKLRNTLWNDTLLRIAAGIVVTIAAGLFVFEFFSKPGIESVHVAAQGEVRADTLPEGSGVFLNRQSSIEYSYDREKKTHIAKLAGEAYFTISHEEEKNFVVKAGETFIKDIGTSFNVKAYPESRTIEVVVEEGEVLFYTEGDPGIRLKAHDRGLYDKDTGKFSISEPGPNDTAYKTRIFTFSDRSLAEVVEALNSVYPTRIVVEDHLKACRLTVSFNNEEVGEIAEVISETLGLTLSRADHRIHLKGPGCGGDKP